jgi:hypothetical protein
VVKSSIDVMGIQVEPIALFPFFPFPIDFPWAFFFYLSSLSHYCVIFSNSSIIPSSESINVWS